MKHTMRLLRHRLKRASSLRRSRLQLKKVGRQPVPDAPEEIRLFCMGRNESLRLPFFIEYYLKKGVDRIFFVENNSTDNTLDIAMQFPNVHVFKTSENFQHYSNWMETLLRTYGDGHWCLAADIDEIFVYPDSEVTNLSKLCLYLEQSGATALQSVLLDMYPGGPISECGYQQGDDPIASSPYFDQEFEETEKIWINQNNLQTFTNKKFSGNLRRRFFGLDTSLSKVPLFKFSQNVFPVRGMHGMDGVKFSEMRGAVLHFKYLQDFDSRVEEEASRGQHEGGAREYKQYANVVRARPKVILCNSHSTKYQSTEQLEQLGILLSSRSYKQFLVSELAPLG